MLKLRIATAIVLLAILLPVVAVSNIWPFAIVTLAGMSLAGWEWGRLNEAGALSVPLGVVVGVACGLSLWAGWEHAAPRLAWWLAMAVWVLGGTWVLRGGVHAWPRLPRALRLAVGPLALWTAWLAMANAKSVGINFLLSVFVIVWAADIFAYFGGRAFGKHKLAPGISPGKSWEGVWSGMLGALVVAGVWLAVDGSGMVDSPSFYGVVAARFSIVGLALVVVFLSAMSVVGDLVESLVKRSAGAKDSSGLLPGHGGVLDRVDALLPVFPIALAIAAL